MDLKGQNKSETTFVSIMWAITVLSALLTFIIDDVKVMFITFAAGLGTSALVSQRNSSNLPYVTWF